MKNQDVKSLLKGLDDYCHSVSMSDCCTENCALYPLCKQDEIEGTKPFMYIINEMIQ